MNGPVLQGAALAALLCTFVFAGCGGGDARAPGEVHAGAAVRDSAGIDIIENSEPLWSAGTGWRVVSVPDLEIGREDGPAEYQFQSIAGIVLRADGALIVADGGTSEIRSYGAAGVFMGGTGRSGDGPGEYRLITAIGAGGGDTLWVYDFGLRRFTLLGPDLQVSHTVVVQADLASLLAVGMTPAGEFVVRESWSSVAQAGELTPGLRRDPAAIALLDAAGVLRDTIALAPGREVIITSENGRAMMGSPVIARATTAAIAGAAVVIGDQAVWELRVYDPAGALQRIIRRTGIDLRLDPADVDAAIDARLATVPSPDQPALRLVLEALPGPAMRPAFLAVLVDDNGRIWAADWSASGEPSGAWAVFESDGRYLGDVAMPAGFRPFSITNGRLAGVVRDDVGVERVRVYRFEQQ